MADDRRVLPMGDRAWLVELPDLDDALRLFASLTAAHLPGVVEAVPAARTVLVKFDPLTTTADELGTRLASLPAAPGAAASGRLVTIAVLYDGDDLAEVAELLGLSESEVIDRHTAATYRVAFGGFAPGFAYLTGGDPIFDVPRRSSPRTRIAAGSVALAGRFSAVYPRESPGGWQLIGRTDQAMWNLDRDPPAALQPGDRVRFVEAGDPPSVEPAETPTDPPPVEPVETPAAALEIVSVGAQALLQDDGRPGMAAMGVPGSGALDRFALHQANRLVGNPSGTVAIEFAFGGAVRALADVVVCVSGERTWVVLTHADGRTTPITHPTPVHLHSGDTLTISPGRGVRTYLAVRGGFDVPAVLGSRSSDVLSGIGPAPLRAGAGLAIAAPAGPSTVGEPEPWPRRLSAGVIELPVMLGPRDDWFTDVDELFAQPWTVTPQSNRVGLRLRGNRGLARAITRELPSEGMVAGAVQVPPDGQPVLFLADHPVTGGYPVIAVLHSSALDKAGQLAPDQVVRFVRASGSTPQ